MAVGFEPPPAAATGGALGAGLAVAAGAGSGAVVTAFSGALAGI